MASYDGAGVASVVEGLLTAGTISAGVAAAINAALAGGGSIDYVSSEDGSAVNVSNMNTDAIIAQDNTPIQGNFGPSSAVQAVIVAEGTDGNRLEFATSNNVSVVLGGGTGDSVQTAAGSDTVEFKGGSATIGTGAGNDEIIISADGTATVDGGTGFDRVTFNASQGEHRIVFEGGRFVAHSGTIIMDNINVVAFDQNADQVIDSVAVLASTAGESVIAKLYQIALGRDILDSDQQLPGQAPEASPAGYQLAGFTWWTENDGAGNENINAAGLLKLVYDFVGTPEFQAKIGSLGSAEEQVAKMFDNMNAQGEVGGKTQADYAQDLASGKMNIAEVALALATSDEAINLMGMNGEQYVIDADFTFPTA